jgi:hypothetical protein
MGRKLETAEWRPFLDRVSKGISGAALAVMWCLLYMSG